MPLKRYAPLVEIPYTTLIDYCRPEVGKRKALGTSVGKQPLFSAEQQQFAVDVFRRHDRGNDGLNKRQCVDKLHDMRPDLNRKCAPTVRTARGMGYVRGVDDGRAGC